MGIELLFENLKRRLNYNKAMKSMEALQKVK
jgi:hypothetical protein